MKYIDVKVFFLTEEQEQLPDELREDIPFSEMQQRVVRFYQIPMAVTVSMGNNKVRGSVVYLNGQDRFFSPETPTDIHDKIERAWN